MSTSGSTFCTDCPYQHESGGGFVPGAGPTPARLMILGEAPGRDEVSERRPFAGAAGRSLDKLLIGAGLHRPDLYITNIVKCRPPMNARPRVAAIDACRHRLDTEIDGVKPAVILCLGATATKAMLGRRTVIRDARGQRHERDGRGIVATYHPSPLGLNRAKDRRKQAEDDFLLAARLTSEGS